MDPTQGDEVILILDQKELLLILSVTVVRSPTLLGHNHMGHSEGVLRLKHTYTHVTGQSSEHACGTTKMERVIGLGAHQPATEDATGLHAP